MQTIPEFFHDKVILITGATGFLGQALVAKILTDLPGVKKIYLLIRNRTEPNGKIHTAEDRLDDEFFTSSVFAKLRQTHREQFDAWIRAKVYAVEGDLAYERLGMSDASYKKLQREVQIFINSAAFVRFDPPIDEAAQLNTLSAKYAVEFARGCNDPVFLHVSTAYVCENRPGEIAEELHPPYETFAAQYCKGAGERIPMTLEAEVEEMFRISEEIRREAEQPERVDQFRRQALRQIGNRKENRRPLDEEFENIREKWIEWRLINEGLKRAHARGWNDTYAYTKALGEQTIAKVRGDLPTAIIRQSIMESSLEEPEPGWLGGSLRMADPIIVGFGKGRLPDFPADPDSILDLIPVDFVVNAMLAAAVQTYHNRGIEVYHIASGSVNPLTFDGIVKTTHEYFVKYPMFDKGKPIPVPVWKYPSEKKFRRKLRHKLCVLNTVSWLLNRIPAKWAKRKNRRIAAVQTAIEALQYYIQIYGPYTRLSFEFETSKTQQLYRSLSPSDQQRFNFDISRIDWGYYLKEVHIPGVKRHALKLGEESASQRISEPAQDSPLYEGDAREGNEPTHQQIGESSKSLEYRTIIDLVAQKAESIPDKTALQIKRADKWVRYSYRQIHDVSRKIAFSLWERDYRKGDRVILFAENQPEWGLAYLAAVQIGLIVVPIDRQTAEGEICALARFTEAKAILTSETLVDRLHNAECLQNTTDQPPEFLNINQFCQPFEVGQPEQLAEVSENFPDVEIDPDTIASIIFTAGTTVDAKGVMLPHRSFVANVCAVAEALPPCDTDRFLSVLPLYHALEFTCGFLMSIYAGATVTYLRTLKPTAILEAMQETKTTVLIGVPRLFKLLYDTIERYVVRYSEAMETPIDAEVVEKVQSALGGHIRVLVSGGAALPNEVYNAFQQFGLTIYQGYGMTETAPVLSVNPYDKSKCGSVGPAVRGVKLRIVNPDSDGIGEIVTNSPGAMKGYYRNQSATEKVIRDGLLYTGDLGYFDEEGYLYITGRSKDVIVSGAGKNIYPVEIEELYRHSPDIAEICVVGMSGENSVGEEVHAVIVPTHGDDQNPANIEKAIREHLQERSRNLPTYQRTHKVHFWETELPRTSNFDIHRRRVKERLQEQLSEQPQGALDPDSIDKNSAAIAGEAPQSATPADEGTTEIDVPSAWESAIVSELSRLTQAPADRICLNSRLDLDLGLDSLARVELLLFLEIKLQQTIPDEMVAQIQTVSNVVKTVKTLQSQPAPHNTDAEISYPIRVEQPRSVQSETGPLFIKLVGLLRFGIRIVYRHYFSIKCDGLENIPRAQPYIIAANHTSHLDTPAIITALEDESRRLRVLAAKDYWFNTRFKSWFFGKLLNFLPFDRTANFLEGIRISQEVLQQNQSLLIYPEGTRSVTGELQPFKPGLGLLAYETGVPIVPAYIDGTYRALPKGKNLPRKSRIQVVFGEPITSAPSQIGGKGTKSHETYREITREIRSKIEALRFDCLNRET